MRSSSRLLLLFVIASALILGAGSCAAPLDAPSSQESFTSAADFFWSRTQLAAGVHFQIVSDTIVENHTLTSSDGSHITDISGSSTGALVIRATRDSILVDSISTHTIFLLPPGFSFASRTPLGVPITTLIELGTGRLVAGSRTSGIYYMDDRSSWHNASGFTGRVDAMTSDSAQNILYAAQADSLFQSLDGGATWRGVIRPKTGTSITALATDVRGRIFVGLAGSGGILRTDTNGNFRSFASSSNSIISIATTDTGSEHYVAGATAQSATVYDDTGKVLSNYSEPNISEIRVIDQSDMLLIGGRSLVQLSLEGSLKWNILSGTSTEDLRSACRTGPFIYAGGDGGTIFQFNNNGVTALQKVSAPINSTITSRNAVLMATDDGVWQYENGATSRLGGPYIDQPHDGAPGLTLIARGPSGLFVGDTWAAGTLYISAVQTSVPVTARIIDHVDSLLSPVPDSRLPRFGETYIVRYARETNGALDRTFPVYWQVYYSRGFGPVIIEEIVPAATGNTFMLKSRATMIQ